MPNNLQAIEDFPIEDRIRFEAINTELAELREQAEAIMQKRTELLDKLDMQFVLLGAKKLFWDGKRFTKPIALARKFKSFHDAEVELEHCQKIFSFQITIYRFVSHSKKENHDH